MQKQSFHSAADISPYGVPMMGPGILDSAVLSKLIKNDSNLNAEKKESILAMIDNPQIFNSLLTGYTGSKVADAVADYMQLNAVTKAMLNMAGFSIGKTIYNIFFTEGKFIKHDAERQKYKVKL